MTQLVRRATRKNIIDVLSVERFQWYGRLDDVAFLGRIWELEELPSTDSRFADAGSDIWQHRTNNSDWPDDWVFTDRRFELMTCADETFLQFLCEMIHPVVRPDVTEARRTAQLLNDLLAEDHFELIERSMLGERPVWAAHRRTLAGVDALPGVRVAKQVFDADYIRQQITRMESAVEADPDLAVGTAKELVETTSKSILNLRGIAVSGSIDLPKLVRTVAKELALVPEGIANETRAADTVRKVLGSLSTLVGGIDDLRNEYGTGHGRLPARTLQPRHAKLVVGAASSLAVFLWETHLARPVDNRGVRGG